MRRRALFVAALVLLLSASAGATPGARVRGATLYGPDLVLADATNDFVGSLVTSVDADLAEIKLREAGAGATVTLYDGETAIATTTADENGAFRFSVELARGAHALDARVDDASSIDEDEPLAVNAAAPPTAPRDLRVAPGRQWDEILLSWTPPADDGGAPITGTFWTSTPPLIFRAYASSTSVWLRATPGADHVVQLWARNDVGSSPLSAPLAFTAPSAPLADALSLRVTGARLCQITCVDAPMGGTLYAPGRTFQLWALTEGTLTNAAEPVAGARVTVKGTLDPHLTLGEEAAVITRADGTFSAAPRAGSWRLAAGECQAMTVGGVASFPPLQTSATGVVTVCTLGL